MKIGERNSPRRMRVQAVMVIALSMAVKTIAPLDIIVRDV
jgi:hypothetical protein